MRATVHLQIIPPVDSCSDHVGEVEKKCGIGSRAGPIKITVETRALIGRNRRQTSSCRLDFLSAQAPPLLPRPTRRAGCHSKRAREIASGHRSLVRLPARSPRVRLSLICRVRLFRRGLAQNDRASRLSPTHFRYRLSHLPSQPFAGPQNSAQRHTRLHVSSAAPRRKHRWLA